MVLKILITQIGILDFTNFLLVIESYVEGCFIFTRILKEVFVALKIDKAMALAMYQIPSFMFIRFHYFFMTSYTFNRILLTVTMRGNVLFLMWFFDSVKNKDSAIR